MQKTMTICDVCSVHKKETNHWWRVWVNLESNYFGIAPFEKLQADASTKDVCGQSCAATLLQRFMATGNLEVEQPATAARPE